MTKLGRDVHINTGGHGSEYGLNPTSSGMSEGAFAMEDFEIAQDKNLGARVSLTIVSEDTPPCVPKNNCDVIYAWCYSIIYAHEVELECFHAKKMINFLLKVLDSDPTVADTIT